MLSKKKHGCEKHRDFFTWAIPERKRRALTQIQCKVDPDSLRVLMKIAQCEKRKKSANGSLPPVKEVTGVLLLYVELQWCSPIPSSFMMNMRRSPLDTFFAVHLKSKSLICLQVACR